MPLVDWHSLHMTKLRGPEGYYYYYVLRTYIPY